MREQWAFSFDLAASQGNRPSTVFLIEQFTHLLGIAALSSLANDQEGIVLFDRAYGQDRDAAVRSAGPAVSCCFGSLNLPWFWPEVYPGNSAGRR